MNVKPKDDLDRAIDDTLASMVGGEPQRVSAASVRQAMGADRGFTLPLWLAAAAVLVVSLGVALRGRAPATEAPIGAAHSVSSPAPIEDRSTPSPETGEAARGAAAGRPAGPARFAAAMTMDAPYEGLPRLTIASIDLPEPLRTTQIDADPIRIPQIEIASLAVSSLSPEQEHR